MLAAYAATNLISIQCTLYTDTETGHMSSGAFVCIQQQHVLNITA